MSIAEKIVGVIEKGEQTKTQLVNQYNNVVASDKISEEEREVIVAALEKQLKLRFPAAAKKIFGARDAQARDLLSEIDANISEDFDLSGNILKNGVKSGGEMIAGRWHIDVYLSYKNQHGYGASIGLRQVNIDDELLACATYNKTGGKEAGEIERLEAGLERKDEIISKYKEFLGCVVTEH